MATTLSVVRVIAAPRRRVGGGSMTSAVSLAAPSCRLSPALGEAPGAARGMVAGPGGLAAAAPNAGRGPSLARAAALMASQTQMRASIRNSREPTLGLGMMSTAPASIASSRVSVPSRVSDEHITTGIGRCCMILRRKVMPSMRGISTSSTMTSGTSAAMKRAAS